MTEDIKMKKQFTKIVCVPKLHLIPSSDERVVVEILWCLTLIYLCAIFFIKEISFHYKTARAGVGCSYTNLTQPTVRAMDWAGIHYTKPVFLCPGGIPSGQLLLWIAS
jgi:hypothetical protein